MLMDFALPCWSCGGCGCPIGFLKSNTSKQRGVGCVLPFHHTLEGSTEINNLWLPGSIIYAKSSGQTSDASAHENLQKYAVAWPWWNRNNLESLKVAWSYHRLPVAWIIHHVIHCPRFASFEKPFVAFPCLWTRAQEYHRYTTDKDWSGPGSLVKTNMSNYDSLKLLGSTHKINNPATQWSPFVMAMSVGIAWHNCCPTE